MTEDQLDKIKESVEALISAVRRASGMLSDELLPMLEDIYGRWDDLKVDDVLHSEYDDEDCGVDKLQNLLDSVTDFLDSVTDYGILYKAANYIYSSLGIK